MVGSSDPLPNYAICSVRLKARDDEMEELRSRLKALLRAGEEERTQYEVKTR